MARKTSRDTKVVLALISGVGIWLTADVMYGAPDPHDRHGFGALFQLGFGGFLLVCSAVGWACVGIDVVVARRERKKQVLDLKTTFE